MSNRKLICLQWLIYFALAIFIVKEPPEVGCCNMPSWVGPPTGLLSFLLAIAILTILSKTVIILLSGTLPNIWPFKRAALFFWGFVFLNIITNWSVAAFKLSRDNGWERYFSQYAKWEIYLLLEWIIFVVFDIILTLRVIKSAERAEQTK